MNEKQAQEMERRNMKALGDPVFLTFTGEVAAVVNGKIAGTGAKCDPGRVLDLGFLGLRFVFAVGERKQVPRQAAEIWMRSNLTTWQDKVVLILEEGAEMVPASETEALRAKIAELEATLASAQNAPTPASPQGAPETQIPTSESGLKALNKAALQAIATKLGLEVSEDASKGMLVEAILKKQDEA